MKKIVKIRTRTLADEISECEHLGYFSNQQETEFVIDHNGWREYKYFNAENVENMDQARENYERAKNFGQTWSYRGVRAEAEVHVSSDGKHWSSHRITTPGIWGVDSDSDAGHFEMLGREQLAELKPILLEFGFSTEEIETAPIDLKVFQL